MQHVNMALIVPWHVHTRMFLKAIRERGVTVEEVKE